MLKISKLFALLFTLINLFPLNSLHLTTSSQKSTKSISKAMIDVIHELYIVNNIKIDIIIYNQTTNHISDIINEVTKKISKEISVKILYFEKWQTWDHELSQSAIIFTKSIKNLHLLHLKSIKSDPHYPTLKISTPKMLKFLIYVEEIQSFDQLRNSMNYHRIFNFNHASDLRIFEFFITSNQNFVDLSANVLYSEENCGEFTIKLLNSFNKKSQNWTQKLENFDQFDNFNGCLLSFEVYINYGPHWYVNKFKKYEKSYENFYEDFAKDDLNFHGLTHEIIDMTAKKRNFTLHYTVINRGINPNVFIGRNNFATFYGDRLVMHNSIMDAKYAYYYWSEPCGSVEYYYLISKNDLYSNYEKLLMPFDFSTWMFLFLTLVIPLGLIFGTYKCSKRMKRIFFNAGIKNPAFNIFAIIFGIPQLALPRKPIARFIIVLFIWFWLIFRTCYQSMLFEFMTSDMRKPLPASIDDLREMNYTIVLMKMITNEFVRANNDIIGGRESPKIQNLSNNFIEFLLLYKEALNGKSKTKYAMLVNNFVHNQLNNTCKNTLEIMDNEKLTKMNGYVVENSKVFIKPFYDTIHWFIPSGIANHLVNYATWLLQRPIDIDIVDPRKILSLTDLEFGFVLWFISLSLPITCFIFELFLANVGKLKEILRESASFIVTKIFELSLRGFMENYHDRW